MTTTPTERPAPPAPAPTPPPTQVPASTRRLRLGRSLEPYAFIAPTAVLMLVLMIVPIVLVIGYSFLDNVILNDDPEFVGVENFVTVLTDGVFATAIGNTLIFTFVSVIAHLLIGLGFAMLLNSPLVSRTSRAVFRVIYILPWLFTAAVIAVLWRMLLNPNGVVNYLLSTDVEWLASPALALASVTFINIWAGYPFFMISLLAALQGIRADLYEAAAMDGTNWFQRFRHVTLPHLRPVVISMAVLDLIWTSHQFALIWMTTGGGPLNSTEMLSTFTYKQAFSQYEFAAASAAAVVVLLLTMVLAFFYVRSLRER